MAGQVSFGAAAVDAPLLGQRVELGGLTSRPELNGQRGVARSLEGGRYAVALEGGGESVRVRPSNLSPAAAEWASSGVVAAPDAVIAAAHRGEEAAVLAWLEGGGRPAAEPAALAAHLGERGKAPRRGEVEEGRAAQRGGGVAARGCGDGGDRGARGVNIFVTTKYETRGRTRCKAVPIADACRS